MERTVITSPSAGSSTTTARFTTEPVPRIATCGWLMIGVSNSAPRLPVLVSVNVPPARSSGLTCPALVRAARSAIFLASLEVGLGAVPQPGYRRDVGFNHGGELG